MKLSALIRLLIIFTAVSAGTSRGETMTNMQAKLAALVSLANSNPVREWATNPPDIVPTNNCQPIYYTTLNYTNKPTKAFAWYAAPVVTGTNKYPGIVLVHGGGGTAFSQWAQLWRNRGFYVIAMDLEGHIPVLDANTNWISHAWAGPTNSPGVYSDINKPIEEQWPYHAIADILLAKGVLKHMAPAIDTNKIGIMGFSWGGMHTAAAIGIDTNWAFAISTYHCGALDMADNYTNSLGTNLYLYKNTYDSVFRLAKVKFPTMWFTWLCDPNFPLASQRACYQQAGGMHTICVKTNMGHGSSNAWTPEDSYAFAQSVVSNANSEPWIMETGHGVDGNTAYAAFEYDTNKTISGASFIYTTNASGLSVVGSNWTVVSVSTSIVATGIVKVSSALPAGTTAWFFNVYAQTGTLAASSACEEYYSPGIPNLSSTYITNRVHAHEEYKIDIACSKTNKYINGIAALTADHMVHVVDNLDEGAWWKSLVGAIDPMVLTNNYLDIASNQISYVHQANMKSIGYFRYTSDAYSQSNHPEWQCLDRSTNLFADARNSDTNREVNVLCVNSAYREFVKIRLQELAARDINYIYYDWCHMPEVCICTACQGKYLAKYGELMPVGATKYSTNDFKMAEFISDSMKETFSYWREAARKIKPTLRFLISGGKYAQHWGDVHISDDFISMADSPKTEFDKDFGGATVWSNTLTNAIPDFYFPSYDLETSIGWSILRDACGGRSPTVWTAWINDPFYTKEQSLAASGALIGYGCVVDMNFGALPDPANYTNAFNWGRSYGALLTNAVPYAWALVHVSEASRNAWIANNNMVNAWTGFFGPTIAAVEALVRERLPYQTITDKQLETGTISTNTKVLILPNTNYLSAAANTKIALAQSNGIQIVRLETTNAWCRTTTRPAKVNALRATLKGYSTNTVLGTRCEISVTGGPTNMHVTAFLRTNNNTMAVSLINDWTWLKGRETTNYTVSLPTAITNVLIKRTKPNNAVTSNTVASMEYYSMSVLN